MKKVNAVAENRFMFNIHKDPFSLFGLPISLFVNESTLNERYQGILQDLHPDQFYGEDAFMKQSAEKLAAYANYAYQSLRSPLKCAEIAVNAKGWQVPGANQQTTNDPVLLMEMMELQEMAKAGDDIRPFYQDSLLQLETALQEDQEAKALTAYSRLKFIARLLGYFDAVTN
jgi:DnaJ-domain-containing protein 1